MPVAVTGYSHGRITVTDIARSRAFYDGVFGFPVAYELPADADEATREQLWFLEFRDPDHIALELMAPAA